MTKTRRVNEDNIISVVTTGSWIAVGVLAAVGLIFGSVRFAAGIIVGGLISIGNFYWLRSILQRVVGMTVPQSASRFTLFKYISRLALLALIFYVLLVHVGIDIVGLLIGLSVIVLSIIAVSILLLTLKGG